MTVATLLDFDGVLVDSEAAHLAAFNEVLATFGIVLSRSEYDEHYLSLDDAAVFRRALAHAGRTCREDDVRSLVAAKGPRLMARFEDGLCFFAGAADLVTRRRARGFVGIVSGALEAEIAFALERLGARSRVDFIVSAETAPASKPDPSPFLLARRLLRGLGHEGPAVAVEDSMGGVASAKGAGLRCVAVTHTYAAERLLEAGADAVVANLAALTDELLERDI